jgi:hypothetical protein
MKRLACELACFLLALGTYARGDRPQTTQRAPVPPAEAQAAATKLIRSVFDEELRQTEPRAVRPFVDQLIQQGRETFADPAARYVLYDLALERAIALGDVGRATQAFDLLATGYAIDAPGRRAEVVESLATKVRETDEARDLADLALTDFAEALKEERFVVAVRLLDAAENAARSAKDVPTAARIAQARVQMDVARKLSQDAADLRRRLADAPDDPAANLALGQHLCLLQGEWKAGLPLLAKGSDATLKDIAARELTAPKGQAAYALANAWWDWAESQSDPAWKGAAQARAAGRYRALLPELRGLPRTVAERRSKVVSQPAAVPRAAGGWILLFKGDDPCAWNTTGRGNTMATPLERVPDDIKFLRLTRLDTGDSIIVPITRANLMRNGHAPEDSGYFRWNGENAFAWGGYHLGITEGPVISGFDRAYGPGKMAALVVGGIDYKVGSGFGHKAHERPDAQAYGWRGEPIPKTAFEIAVTTGPAEVTPTPESPLPGLPPWRIVPGLATKAGAPRAIGAYEVVPPAGYTAVESLEDSTVRFYRAAAAFPSGVGLPRLSVTLGKLDSIDQNRSVESSSNAKKAMLHQEVPGYHETSSELGTIHDLAFLRNRFEGSQAGTNPPVAVKGVTYYAIDGPTWIRITAIAEASEAERVLPRLEAAAGTFRRR